MSLPPITVRDDLSAMMHASGTSSATLQDPRMIEFIDGANGARPVPPWVGYLVRFGYHFAANKSGARHISLISLPGDSPGGALVALGAMRRRLESQTANDISSHFERIKSGVVRGDRVSTLRHVGTRSRYKFDRVDQDGTLWLLETPSNQRTSRKSAPRFPVRISVSSNTSANWQFEGEAPLHVLPGQALPWRSIYQGLPVHTDAGILGANLATTDSAICLAGRIAGDAPTRAMCDSVGFRADGLSASLGSLLSIQEWVPGKVSRVSYFNPRTDRVDRGRGHTTVVIADGDGSFLDVISHSLFETCHVIGVMSRIIGRDQLESVGSKLEAMRQWFEVEDDPTQGGEAAPLGIRVMTLKARQG